VAAHRIAVGVVLPQLLYYLGVRLGVGAIGIVAVVISAVTRRGV